jgi:predicted  nucleic acid-binding Zn-ribbon protein
MLMAHMPDTTQELSLLHTENRHLKDTIATMRESLEALVLDKNAAVQREAAASRDEIENMKAAVVALREALEALRIERDRQVQEAVAHGKTENRQLQNAVQALRDRMDQALQDERDRSRLERRTLEDELAQLRQTVVVLREALEAGGRR